MSQNKVQFRAKQLTDWFLTPRLFFPCSETFVVFRTQQLLVCFWPENLKNASEEWNKFYVFGFHWNSRELGSTKVTCSSCMSVLFIWSHSYWRLSVSNLPSTFPTPMCSLVCNDMVQVRALRSLWQCSCSCIYSKRLIRCFILQNHEIAQSWERGRLHLND